MGTPDRTARLNPISHVVLARSMQLLEWVSLLGERFGYLQNPYFGLSCADETSIDLTILNLQSTQLSKPVTNFGELAKL